MVITLNSINVHCWISEEALLLESRILALSAPAVRSVKCFKTWFTSASIPVLWGHDEHLFDKEKGLLALAPVDTDKLDHILIAYFGWLFRVCRDLATI